MVVSIPAAKCVVMSGQEEVSKGDSGEHDKSHYDNHSQLALILIMPDGKEIRLLIKDCERGQAQLTLPDES